MQQICNLGTLEAKYQLHDVRSLTLTYPTNNPDSASNNSASEVSHLISAALEAFNTLQVAIPTFNNDGDTIHHARCTGLQLFWKREQRSDWVFVLCRKAGMTKSQGALDGRVPARLNGLFKLRDSHANMSYRLAYESLLSVVRSPTPDSTEGMV